MEKVTQVILKHILENGPISDSELYYFLTKTIVNFLSHIEKNKTKNITLSEDIHIELYTFRTINGVMMAIDLNNNQTDIEWFLLQMVLVRHLVKGVISSITRSDRYGLKGLSSIKNSEIPYMVQTWLTTGLSKAEKAILDNIYISDGRDIGDIPTEKECIYKYGDLTINDKSNCDDYSIESLESLGSSYVVEDTLVLRLVSNAAYILQSIVSGDAISYTNLESTKAHMRKS